MDTNQLVLLLILFSPLIASVLVLIIGRLGDGAAKWSALIFSLVPLALTIYLWVAYQSAPADPDGFKFVFSVPWLPQINSNFAIGVDGISLAMILLTAILTPLGIIISFRITDRLPLFMALLLGLTTGMFGVFMALDLVIFFVFWEIGLVPMYFLINQWGSANRRYASFKFFIYTMAGSIGLLLSIQFIWSALGGTNGGTYSIPEIARLWPSYAGQGVLGLSIETIKNITFWLFVIAFA